MAAVESLVTAVNRSKAGKLLTVDVRFVDGSGSKRGVKTSQLKKVQGDETSGSAFEDIQEGGTVIAMVRSIRLRHCHRPGCCGTSPPRC